MYMCKSLLIEQTVYWLNYSLLNDSYYPRLIYNWPKFCMADDLSFLYFDRYFFCSVIKTHWNSVMLSTFTLFSVLGSSRIALMERKRQKIYLQKRPKL